MKVSTKTTVSDSQQQKTLTNFNTYLLICASSFYIFYFLFTQHYLLANSLIIVECLFCLSILFNKFHLYNLSRINLLFTANLSAFIYALFFGESAGTQFLFFSFTCLPLVIFSFKDIKKIIIGSISPSLLFFLYYKIHTKFTPMIVISRGEQNFIFISISILTFTISFVCVLFLLLENKKYIFKLNKRNDAFQQTNILLESKNLEIQKTQTLLKIEYQKAAQTQQQFLPNEMPEIEGYAIQHFFKGAYGVSGDFYDFRQFGFITKFVVADVMSKSLSAAFITAHLYSIFRTLVTVETTPSKVLTIINQAFVDGRHDYEKAAAFAFDLDSNKNTITYSNACIGVSYLISAGAIQALDYCGFMTGGQRTEVYEEKTISMTEGDILLIASDGLEDIKLRDGTLFGNDRLLEVIKNYLKETPENVSIKDFIVDHIQKLADFESILADDIVLLVVERLSIG